MPVYPPGFSERVFEFGFNSEYAAQNRAVLAAAPHIPTQNEEKALGYDVAFEIKQRGGAVYSVALQHKTCRFVDAKSATNRKFWNATGGPYFAFRLDAEQFNLIESIASSGLPGIRFVYCAPRFSTRKDMDKHYLANSVLTESVWIDPKGVGSIADNEAHSLIFDAAGTKAFMFSEEPRELTITGPRHRPERDQLERDETIAVARAYETVYGAIARLVSDDFKRPRRRVEESEFRVPAELPPFVHSRDESTLIRALADLFANYVGVSWLVEVRQ